jgi:hypothetical protein
MTSDDERITLRSYRAAFELERRLHRVDRFRLPVPYGVPLAGLGYAAATVIMVLIARKAPGVGLVVGAFPVPIQLVFVPGLSAYLLCRVRSDGRPAHEALVARAMFVLRPKRLIALRRAPAHARLSWLAMVGDERTSEYPRGTVLGPAVVYLRRPAQLSAGHNRAVLTLLAGRPLSRARALQLEHGQRLVTR